MDNFKSLLDLLEYFEDEQTCIKYYAQIRWGEDGIPDSCPHCGSVRKAYVTNRGYKCSDPDCRKKFTVRTGTIFESSKIPFKMWFAAIYLATTSKKGISSVQLAQQLGVTQKTAWFMLHRIREMLKDKNPDMLDGDGAIEVDETYVGGAEKNRHVGKMRNPYNGKTYSGEPYVSKKIVVGIIERGGNVVLKHVPKADVANTHDFIKKNVAEGSTVYTDEAPIYKRLSKTYKHGAVTHSSLMFAEGDVHTNTIENFWSTLKRGLYGIYHQVSDKHVERYLDEFSARFNARTISANGKFNRFLGQSESRLSYNNLVHDN